jgi:hypothetical protein
MIILLPMKFLKKILGTNFQQEEPLGLIAVKQFKH